MNEDKIIYSINVGNFTVEETVYPNRCLSASFGGQGVQSEVIPWEDTEYNPWDFKYDNGQFVLEPIEIPTPTPEPSQLDKIDAQATYTAMMTGTLIEE